MSSASRLLGIVSLAMFGAVHPGIALAGQQTTLSPHAAQAVDCGGVQAEADRAFAATDYVRAATASSQLLELLRAGKATCSVDYAIALNNHALNLDRLRRGAEAEPFFIEALERKRAADGAQHPDVLVILHNYALMLEGLGRYSQAEPLFREELQLSFALNGPASSDALDSLSAYAVTLAQLVVRF